jgi:hypothetical protein
MIGAVYPIRPPPGRAAERAVNKDSLRRVHGADLLSLVWRILGSDLSYLESVCGLEDPSAELPFAPCSPTGCSSSRAKTAPVELSDIKS